MLMIILVAALILILGLQGKLGGTGKTVLLTFMAGCAVVWGFYHPSSATNVQSVVVHHVEVTVRSGIEVIRTILAQV